MNGAENAGTALKKWLQTAHGYQYIQHLADRLQQESRWRAGLSIGLRQRFGPDPDDLRDEIAQEFITFLLQRFLPRLSSRPEQVNALLTGQVRKVLNFALQEFSWRLQDDGRRKDVSPRTYLYRRLREELQQDDRFVVHRDGENGSFYSLASLKTLPFTKTADFSRAEYGRWPPPPEPASHNALFTAKYLIKAALFFLEETGRHNMATEAVPVRELVRYLSGHFSRLTDPRPVDLPGNDSLPASTPSPEEQFAHISALESIAPLAHQFVLSLDEDARKILYWKLEESKLTFKKIGRLLDCSDHNRPYRIHKKTIDAMRRFCTNWPGPPLYELSDEVGIAFIESVRKKCKESVS